MKLIEEPQRILIVRFSSIGDVVLITPLLRVLRQRFPDAEIDFLTKEAYAPLVAYNPHLSRVVTMSEAKDGLKAALNELGREPYDWLVDLHSSLRSRRVKLAVKARNRFQVHKRNFQKWMLVRVKRNRLPEEEHVVDRYFKALEKTGIENDEIGAEIFFPEDESWEKLKIPARWAEGYNALAIGAAHETKKLPYGYLRELCQIMPRPVVLLGGGEDLDTGHRLSLESGPHVYNACGRFGLLESAQAIWGATQVFTHDTGMMHIAAALQKPIVSFWGNTVPAFGFFPYYGRKNQNRAQIMEVEGLSCRPCSKLGHAKCPKKHFRCMRDQDFGLIEWI